MKTLSVNILETSTVTLSAGAQNPSYPLYRLYDRDIGKLFKASAAATLEVKIDQGASNIQAIDRLIIPAGHNLGGMTLDIKHSADDATYTASVSQWVQSGSGLINKDWPSESKRYWKLIITSPASAPEFAELFLGPAYTWQRLPSRPAGPFDDVFNVEHAETASGQDRFLIHGSPKRQRVYRVVNAASAQKADILSLYSAWQGAKPFWLEDHEGAWLYGRLRRPLELKETSHGRYGFDFDFEEVI